MMTSNRTQRTSAREDAFGLLELMIAIGLVAVLAFLTVSAVNRAVAAGRSAKCLSQLRKIYVGLILYSQDYKGHLPPATSPRSDEYTWNVPWTGLWCAPATLPEKGFPNYVEGGIEQARKLLICPENVSETPNYQIPANFRHYYLCNYDLMTSSGYSTPPARLAEIRTSDTILLLDAATGSHWASAGLPSHAYKTLPVWNRIGENHAKRVNVLWADGHITATLRDDLMRENFERKNLQ